MQNIEDILKEWKIDSVINNMALDDESIKTASLHAKYLEMLVTAKLELKYFEAQLEIKFKNKWLYYSGKMDKGTVDRLGWDPDPFDGLKIMKSDLDYYYKSDTDLQALNSKIDLAKTIVDTLDEIINTIRWRHSTIKNIIDWRRFTSGG